MPRSDNTRDHPFDGIADELFDWMNEEVQYHVEAIRGGYRSPFSAPVSEKDKKDFWSRQMFQSKPDGTILYDQPNQQGRDQVLKQYGVQAYADILKSVRPSKGFRPPLEPTAEPDMPEMPEDVEPVEPSF